MTALGDFSAGDVLTAADLNAIGTWTSFTTTLEAATTDPSVTTSAGIYYEMNEIVIARVTYGGFTSAGSGTYYAIMPTDIDGDLFPIAFGLYSDGSTRYSITGAKSSSGARRVFFLTADGANIVDNTTPFVPSASDVLRATVIYRKA